MYSSYSLYIQRVQFVYSVSSLYISVVRSSLQAQVIMHSQLNHHTLQEELLAEVMHSGAL